MTVSFLYQEGKSALLRAAKTGNISAVKRELSGHTDVNSQDEVCHYMSLLNRNILFHLTCSGWNYCSLLCCNARSQ